MFENTHEQAPPTHAGETALAVPAGAGKSSALAVIPKSPAERRRAGNQKGGMRPKSSVALTGLGLTEPPVIDLDSHDGRMLLLSATAEAVVRGACSSATATTLVSIVRAAGDLARGDQEEEIRELTRRVEELVVPGR
jgi:hypothetical protein